MGQAADTDNRRKAAVLGAAGAALAAAALAAVSAAHGAVGPITGTSPLAPPLGACLGTRCPGTSPPVGNGDFPGRDAAINIFTGTDFSATGRAAEAEGKVVVLNDFTVDKSGGGLFNMGVAGVGSRVPPPDGDDFLTVGRNATIRPGNRIEVGGSDSKGPAWGNVRYGGTLSGSVDIAPDGKALHDANAVAQYSSLRGYIEERSACAASAPVTGSVTVESSQVTFHGDGSSRLQVFDVPGDIGGARTVGIAFTGIPAGATVLVNMTGTAPTINTYTGTGLAGDQLTELRPRLMWNFPNATAAAIRGGAQFQGSILGGAPNGTLTISTPGQNGRVHLAGGLVLTSSSGGGEEIHAYPFDGVLPECGSAVVTTTEPTTTGITATESGSSPSSSPSTSTTSTTSTTTSTSATSTTPGPRPDTTTPPTTPARSWPSVTASAAKRGLAATGGAVAPFLGLAAAALAVGAAVLALTGRKKGTHA